MAKESDSKIPIEIMNGELNEEFLHFVDCRVNFENIFRSFQIIDNIQKLYL